MTTAHDEQLARIFGDAEALGYLDPKHGPVMHEQVLALYIDMMLDLAAAQQEIETLKAQRDATRIYLGVALCDSEDENGNDSPEAILRMEVKRIVAAFPDRKIQAIKELRGSDLAASAWADLGNRGSWDSSRCMSLKDSKDIIDSAYYGDLYLGPTRKSVPL